MRGAPSRFGERVRPRGTSTETPRPQSWATPRHGAAAAIASFCQLSPASTPTATTTTPTITTTTTPIFNRLLHHHCHHLRRCCCHPSMRSLSVPHRPSLHRFFFMHSDEPRTPPSNESMVEDRSRPRERSDEPTPRLTLVVSALRQAHSRAPWRLGNLFPSAFEVGVHVVGCPLMPSVAAPCWPRGWEGGGAEMRRENLVNIGTLSQPECIDAFKAPCRRHLVITLRHFLACASSCAGGACRRRLRELGADAKTVCVDDLRSAGVERHPGM